jgi:hypothetical protein
MCSQSFFAIARIRFSGTFRAKHSLHINLNIDVIHGNQRQSVMSEIAMESEFSTQMILLFGSRRHHSSHAMRLDA